MNQPKQVKRQSLMIPNVLIGDHMIESRGWEHDTYWIYLKPGYICLSTETHSISESSTGEAIDRLKDVVTCDCEECKELLKKAL